MSDSKKSGKKPIQDVGRKRACKAKLERINRVTTKNEKSRKAPQGLEDLYRAIMGNTFFGFTLIDHNYKVLMVNEVINRYFHKSASELIGKKCFRVFEKRQSICPHCPGKRAMATGQPAEVETEKVRDDGSRFLTRIQAFPTLDSKGAVTGFIKIAEDITEHKKAEETLRESEARLRSFQDSATDGLMVFDSRLNLTDVNKAALEILSVNKRDMIGKNILEISPDVKTTGRYDKYLEVLRTGKACFIDEVVPHPKFRDRHLSLRVFKVGDGLGIIGTDITERKKAEQKLKQYQFMVESAHHAIFFKDLESRYIIANNRALEAIGLPHQQVIGKDDYEVLASEDEAKKNIEDDKIVFKTGKPTEITNLMSGADGKQRWFQAIKVPQFDDKGRIIGLVGIARDITEHKKAEQEIKKSKDLLEKTFLSLDSAVFILDNSDPPVIIDCNPAATKIFGYAKEELLGETTEFLHVDRKTLLEFQKILYPAIEKQDHLSFLEFRMKKKNGQTFPTEHFVRALKSEDCKRIGWVSVVRDITERKKAEQALRESEEKYRNIFENAREAIITIDLKGNITCVNKLVEEYGFKREDLIGKNHFEFIAERYRAGAIKEFENLVRGGTDEGEIELITPRGNVIVEFRDNPIKSGEEIVGIQTILTDITERKKAEQELIRLSNAIKMSTDSIVISDLDAKITDVNEAALKMYGTKDKSDLIGKNSFDFIAAEDQKKARAGMKEVMEKGYVRDREYHVVISGGRKVPVEMSVSLMKDANGKPIGFVGITRDITRRKKAEQTLKRERDKAQTYLDVAAVMIIAIDSEGRVGLINKKGCEILGYAEDEILGKNWFNNFLPKGVRDNVKEVFNKVLAGDADGPEYYENPILTKDGVERLIAWHNTILRDDKGEVIATLSSGEDITERKKAEEKVLENQQQLKSLASQLTLAEESERHRIATELHSTIGQSLVILKMKLDELRSSTPSKELTKTLDEICDLLGQNIQEAKTLTFDLSSPILYELGLEKAVAEWLSEQIENKHGIKTKFIDDGKEKPLDDEMRVFLFRDIRELLFNVIKHAQAKNVKVSISKVAEQIQVTVEDDGWGFDPVKVMDMAVQTGAFGLFSIRQRLELLGGLLDVDSAPGHGTKITITAPLKREKETLGK